ncbi:MAG: Uncharacterized UPF0126 inner membrane protein, partial [uncultured Nocardioides sp.]
AGAVGGAGRPGPRRDLRLRHLRRPGGRAQGLRPLRGAGARRRHRARRRLPARRAHRRHPARGPRRLALPVGAGGRGGDHVRLPSGRGPDGARRECLRRLRSRALLRHRRPQGHRVRPRPAAGRADGHGHRDRRRDGPRRAGRPGAHRVPRRAVRHPGARRRPHRRARGALGPAHGGRRAARCGHLPDVAAAGDVARLAGADAHRSGERL